ncbi:MAG TPA: hypothetical protein VJR58_06275 [Vineibacter sp.]|nr:hypothetical protein [Vineibacter sp.]
MSISVMRRNVPASPQSARVRLAPHKYDDNSRIFAVAFLRFFQQVCRLHMELFDGDISLALVAGAVAIANVETRMRDPAFRRVFSSVDTVIDIDQQRGCNVLSVAESTLLPRETARRKMNRLVEMGILVRRGAGDYVMQPHVLQSEPFLALFRGMSQETIRLANECLDKEVFATSGAC